VREQVPGIEIRGHDGYFDQSDGSADSEKVIKDMNDYKADLVLVGFGTPRQEAGLGVEFSAVRKPAPLCVSLRRRAGVAGRLPGTWLVHIETFGSCC